MNMSKVLSGDTMAGFKRWQVPDVAVGETRDSPAGNNKYLTAVQLERIQRQAYDEAYARGLKEGIAAGQSQIKEQARIFIGLANSLQNPINHADEEIESEIVLLCLAIAKQIIRREITLDSGHIISVIREALAALPMASQKIRVSLHPEDVVLVRKVLAELNEDISWSIVDDITLSRGGCKVATENSRIDATLEARMAMIASKILVDERSDDQPE
jgi:flagellar assembly protein FliH